MKNPDLTPADFSHNKLAWYVKTSLACKKKIATQLCHLGMLTSQTERGNEHVFNHFYDEQKHHALWLHWPQHFSTQASSSDCCQRLKTKQSQEEVVFLAAVKNLKMKGGSSFLVQFRLEARMYYTLKCGTQLYKCVSNCVQASDSGKGDIWLWSMSQTAG